MLTRQGVKATLGLPSLVSHWGCLALVGRSRLEALVVLWSRVRCPLGCLERVPRGGQGRGFGFTKGVAVQVLGFFGIP